MDYYNKKPWGYEQVLVGYVWPEKKVIKNLVVFAGQRISLQYHEKRTEEWAVMSGQCLIEIDKDIVPAFQGTEFTIFPCIKHRVTAITDTVIRETSYDYEENDIVRLADDYGRKDK